ncbi:hypothetical protein JR316_0007736 [Psilocybe cubensis]|uniref:DUF6593 domain-containing protein n=2 Tax=Psilocybe cubensis TaxID=181762 RepID=A0A8H7XSS4_PSICU|nr:hypothetical protein JR316_0007736 [Psilocybe cubensis]KAH9479153.1 hypothetical protein JR316_0007736 [Psilocybe cubensis]
MYTNPFGAFWDLPGVSDASNEQRLATGSSGLTFGALPLADNPCTMKFTFNSHQTGVLNSNVTGPNTLVYFNVSSSTTTTTVSRKNGDVYATVEWTRHPMMQIYGETGRIPTSHWISLSPDRTQRVVMIKGRYYYWIPRGTRICLYGDDDETATISGEIAHISRTDGEVSLNISLVAFNNGFLDACVLATVLFMSGRNID